MMEVNKIEKSQTIYLTKINDFILTLDEDSDSYDDDRGDILGDINCGELDEEDYPKIPEDINNLKYYEYRILK